MAIANLNAEKLGTSIDFKEIDVSVISVEHNYDKNKLEDISAFLDRFGYIEILPGVFEFDAIFAKREIEQTLRN